jgi:cytochrome c-type biogenesis protein CcmE
MSSRVVRVGASAVVIVSALVFLMMKTVTEGAAYYKHVHEIAGQHEQWYGKNMQLHGFVAKDSILTNRQTLEWRFTVQSEGHSVPVFYKGLVPDTFKDEAEVVLKGTLQADGFHVSPGGVVAKCPSKYEPGSAAAAAGPYR